MGPPSEQKSPISYVPRSSPPNVYVIFLLTAVHFFDTAVSSVLRNINIFFAKIHLSLMTSVNLQAYYLTPAFNMIKSAGDYTVNILNGLFKIWGRQMNNWGEGGY